MCNYYQCSATDLHVTIRINDKLLLFCLAKTAAFYRNKIKILIEIKDISLGHSINS